MSSTKKEDFLLPLFFKFFFGFFVLTTSLLFSQERSFVDVLCCEFESPLFKEIEPRISEIEATLDEEKIKEMEAFLKKGFENDSKNFIFPYYLSRLYFSYANLFEDHRKDDWDKTKDYLDESLKYVKMAIELNPNFSDSFRMAGDCYGRLIEFKPPMIYGPLYGKKAGNMVDKALKINPNNPEAHLAKGRNYLFTPRVFGGSKKKALECFKKGESILPSYHWSYIWQGQAYLKMKKKEEAKVCFEKALSLEPRNGWAKKELERLK